MNHALILATQLRLNGTRHQFQLGPSYFRKTITPDGRLWLEETYRIYNHHLEKEDMTDFLGPFTPEEFAAMDFTIPTAAGTYKDAAQ